MRITAKWLTDRGACVSAEEKKRAETEGEGDVTKIVMWLMDNNRFEDANWLVVHYMSHQQNLSYAIFCARAVLHLFESRYPDDPRPGDAIEAAEAVMNGQNEKDAFEMNVLSDAAFDAYDKAEMYAEANNVGFACVYAAYAAHAVSQITRRGYINVDAFRAANACVKAMEILASEHASKGEKKHAANIAKTEMVRKVLGEALNIIR